MIFGCCFYLLFENSEMKSKHVRFDRIILFEWPLLYPRWFVISRWWFLFLSISLSWAPKMKRNEKKIKPKANLLDSILYVSFLRFTIFIWIRHNRQQMWTNIVYVVLSNMHNTFSNIHAMDWNTHACICATMYVIASYKYDLIWLCALLFVNVFVP